MSIKRTSVTHTLEMSDEELCSLVAAVQTIELYEGQGADLKANQLDKEDIAVLRQFRATFDEEAGDNIRSRS